YQSPKDIVRLGEAAKGLEPGYHYIQNIPVDLPFDGRAMTMQAGDTYKVHVKVKSTGTKDARHVVNFHAANATVNPTSREVTVPAGQEVTVTADVVPAVGGETLVVLAELDNDHQRKWDFTAVALVNPAWLKGTLKINGKNVKTYVPYEVVDADGKVVFKGRVFKNGSTKPIDLGTGGTFKIRCEGKTSELFTIEKRSYMTREFELN
ncbi:MAG: hypothetical protein ACYTFY_23355, partial [Planctomycetota bacterium]